MTIAQGDETATAIVAVLAGAEKIGAIKFGVKQMKLHRQQESQCLLILAV